MTLTIINRVDVSRLEEEKVELLKEIRNLRKRVGTGADVITDLVRIHSYFYLIFLLFFIILNDVCLSNTIFTLSINRMRMKWLKN